MTELSRQYAKLCDVRDFEDPALLSAIRSIVPERDPLAYVERKVWEFAVTALFLEEVGRLHEGTRALSVGAGDERILFWLAQRVGRVVATDVYGEGDFAGAEADASMLRDPASHSPYPYPEDRLEVRWMDARELDFPTSAFDVVFTISSIEHFGSPRDIARAASEIGRVLCPGGHAVIVTDLLVRRHPRDTAPVDAALRALTLGRKRPRATLRRRGLVEAFTERELRRWVIAPSGLRRLQPLDMSLSPESWENVMRHTRRGLVSRTGEPYPHVLVQAGRSVFTSACVVLEKPVSSQGA